MHSELSVLDILGILLSSPDPCSRALRVIVLVWSSLLLLLLISWLVVKRTQFASPTHPDVALRIRVLGLLLFGGVGASYGAVFSYVCTLPADCQEMFELNCSGVMPTVYGTGFGLGLGTIGAGLVLEWWRRKKKRTGAA